MEKWRGKEDTNWGTWQVLETTGGGMGGAGRGESGNSQCKGPEAREDPEGWRNSEASVSGAK